MNEKISADQSSALQWSGSGEVVEAPHIDSQTMRAGVLYGVKDLRLESRPVPATGDGEALLRVRNVGICGSDTHYFLHGRCGVFVPIRPFILGHEVVATVEAVGQGVTTPAVGERVVVHPARSCGRCTRCQGGRANLCRHLVMLGSASTTPPTDGAFAEYVAVAAHQCYPVPPTVSDEEAAMMEPLSVALHAVRRAGNLTGATVLVTGGGPIGLLTAMVCMASGAGLATLSEPLGERRAAASSLGLDRVFDPTEDTFVEQARSTTNDGFDVIFEASGSPSALRQAFDVAARGATIVQIGTMGAEEVSLPMNRLMTQEIAVVGTFRYVDEFSAAIRLVGSGRLNIRSLISDVYLLDDLDRAISRACSPTCLGKVQLSIDSSA